MASMLPTLFRIGPVEFGAFGLMAAAGFLAAYWTLKAELRRRALPPAVAPDMFIAAVVGGVVGARANFIV